MGACWSSCWGLLCGGQDQDSSDTQQPLLGGAGRGGGQRRGDIPENGHRHGLKGLERRMERKYSSAKVRVPYKTANLLGRGHRDISRDYCLGPVLGQGAFGVVRQASHRKTEERYAVKTIVKSKLRRVVEFEDVKREVQILELLSSHPNVAALVATYEDDSSVHLVLELCEGGELFERIAAAGSLTERQAARYFQAMVEVVRHCHALGIMHRDIKPENFLLSTKGDDAVVRAADFGLSQFFRPGKHFHSLVGSAFYVAPEVLRRDYGPAADIWSLGVCLYILLSGLTPFWGDCEEEIFDMVLGAELDFDTPPWPHISRAAKDLVRRMMERDPDKRPSAADILQHPWLLRLAPDVRLDDVVITRMRNFAAMSKVKRAAMLVAAQGLTQEDIPELHALFHSLDADQSGRLSTEEFRRGLIRVGTHMSERDLDALVQGADMDGDGEIDYAEFVAATLGQSYTGREEFVRSLFAKFDADHSGYVSAGELRALLCDHGVTRSEIDMVVRQADTDGDQQISFQEFVHWLSSNTNSIQEAVRRRWSGIARHSRRRTGSDTPPGASSDPPTPMLMGASPPVLACVPEEVHLDHFHLDP